MPPLLVHLTTGSGLARCATAAATATLLMMGGAGCDRDDASGTKAATNAKPVPPKSPQVERLEGNIRSGIAARYGARVTAVMCPETLAVRAGNDITCQVRVEGSELPLEVTVSWTNDAGAFAWRDRGVVRLDKLQALVAQKLSADKRVGSARCKGTIRVSQPGSTFECPIAYDDGTTGAVSVRVRTWQGDVDLQFR